MELVHCVVCLFEMHIRKNIFCEEKEQFQNLFVCLTFYVVSYCIKYTV